MDFELTGGQRDLVAQTRDYAERVVRPAAARLEQLSREHRHQLVVTTPAGCGSCWT